MLVLGMSGIGKSSLFRLLLGVFAPTDGAISITLKPVKRYWQTGASSVEELKIYLERAGFSNINIETKEVSKEYAEKWANNLKVGKYIMSASIMATKL